MIGGKHAAPIFNWLDNPGLEILWGSSHFVWLSAGFSQRLENVLPVTTVLDVADGSRLSRNFRAFRAGKPPRLPWPAKGLRSRCDPAEMAEGNEAGFLFQPP